MTPMKTRNPWVHYVVHAYWSMRMPQLTRLEDITRVHDSESEVRNFYEREERITFRDTLIRCSVEWRAMKGAA